jgi:hypothetical protein
MLTSAQDGNEFHAPSALSPVERLDSLSSEQSAGVRIPVVRPTSLDTMLVRLLSGRMEPEGLTKAIHGVLNQPSVPPGKCWDGILNQASFHSLSNSLSMYHPFIRCYIISVAEKVSLNKLHINSSTSGNVPPVCEFISFRDISGRSF